MYRGARFLSPFRAFCQAQKGGRRHSAASNACPVCSPRVDDWWAKQPPGANPFKPDVTDHTIENIELNAGDLLIFNSQLAHGVRPNISENDVRMAQYISMFPADFDNEPLRQARITTWADQTHPIGIPFPGDPRAFEKTNFAVAALNPLGRKLLGLDRWT